MTTLHYHVTALQMPIYFNSVRLDDGATCKGTGSTIVGGDHDHSGLMYALSANVPVLEYLRSWMGGNEPSAELAAAANARAQELRLPRLPADPAGASLPHRLVRPLVLRARRGETVIVELHNEIQGRRVGMHLIADGYDPKRSDGSAVGRNPSSLARTGESVQYEWHCNYEGVFVFHDAGNYDGLEEGNEGARVADDRLGSSNLRGLFGALAVEPERAIWRDPETGQMAGVPGMPFRELDGLYMDILFPEHLELPSPAEPEAWTEYEWPEPKEYTNFCREAHREYVIVFHDEPAFVPPHLAPNHEPLRDPCQDCEEVTHHGHGAAHAPPIMPVSYRAEPMINREHELYRLICADHDFKGRPVLNEEQHHSSWMFGDPATPVLKAYMGDPFRIRLVHGGVMETHVFHLHLYEWHAVPQDQGSPRIDAISFSPQTGHTIEPVWGAGNRHQVAGDVIWHCHLYPHFHEGMWGMLRTFETLQLPPMDPETRGYLPGEALDNDDPVYQGRRIGQYPDGTPIERLLPLPGRPLPPRPTVRHPGFPLFIPGECRQKSPVPPWPDRDYEAEEMRWCDLPSLRSEVMPGDFDYRDKPYDLERAAFNERPLPAEMFTRNPMRGQQSSQWAGHPRFARNKVDEGGQFKDVREVCHDIGVTNQPVVYNHSGWVDPRGHFYYLEDEGTALPDAQPREPLFFRAWHGQILNLTLKNRLDSAFPADDFDAALPPCPARGWEGECALHVHMVKFDPICADGASTGWNYMSGPTFGKRMAYRWWLDQEFGTIFFHDHLFANFRQKRGLFGALLVEPAGSTFWSNDEEHKIVSGLQARIERHPEDNVGSPSFREFCLALADFIPLYDRLSGPRTALNPPHAPGSHGDQGVMGINYRNEPILLRSSNQSASADPAHWFSSSVHGDPATTGFATHAGDPIWFRLVQGSHEEQHSFQIHGMRWRRFRGTADSRLRNQQTFGLSEAFTLIHDEPYGAGDYLYKLSGADDLWLGCWGLIRAFPRSAQPALEKPTPSPGRSPKRIREPLPLPAFAPAPTPAPPALVRRFEIEAVERRIVYRRGTRGRADIIDPFGLVYRVVAEAEPGEEWRPVSPSSVREPLVLRCREGELVEVTLHNRVHGELEVEPHPPLTPLDDVDRHVSRRVSLHADLVLYDVQTSDGATVGLNPDQTVGPGDSITYRWRTDRPSAESNERRPLGPVLLQDFADFRHHRHHGLVGALVIEAADATPWAVAPRRTTAAVDAPTAWHGARVTVTQGGETFEEMVLLMQDGLRLYWNGDTRQPLSDPPDEEGMPDYEDQGQKGFSYGTEPRGPQFDSRGEPDIRPHRWLRDRTPATPLWYVRAGESVVLHLVGACDKPRNHSFTVHGVAWPEFRSGGGNPTFNVSAESAVTTGTVRTFRFTPQFTGDHAYRSGLLRWDVPQGMWGILRVAPRVEVQVRIVTLASLGLFAAWLGWKAWSRHRSEQSVRQLGQV